MFSNRVSIYDIKEKIKELNEKYCSGKNGTAKLAIKQFAHGFQLVIGEKKPNSRWNNITHGYQSKKELLSDLDKLSTRELKKIVNSENRRFLAKKKYLKELKTIQASNKK